MLYRAKTTVNILRYVITVVIKNAAFMGQDLFLFQDSQFQMSGLEMYTSLIHV